MQNLEDLLTFLEKNLKKVSTELEEAPTGTLVRVTDRGKVKYLKSDKVDDGYRRKHADPDADIVKALVRKEYLRIEKELLESDIALIRNINRRYVEPTPENILNRVKKAYDKYVMMHFNIMKVREVFQQRTYSFRVKCKKMKSVAKTAIFKNAIDVIRVKECKSARMLPVLLMKMKLNWLAGIIYMLRVKQNEGHEKRGINSI